MTTLYATTPVSRATPTPWRALSRDAALMAARKIEAGERDRAESLMRLAAMVVTEGRA